MVIILLTQNSDNVGITLYRPADPEDARENMNRQIQEGLMECDSMENLKNLLSNSLHQCINTAIASTATEITVDNLATFNGQLKSGDELHVSVPRPFTCDDGVWMVSCGKTIINKKYTKAGNETQAEFEDFIRSNDLLVDFGYDREGNDAILASVHGDSPHDIALQLRGSHLSSVSIMGSIGDLLAELPQELIDLVVNIPPEVSKIPDMLTW